MNGVPVPIDAKASASPEPQPSSALADKSAAASPTSGFILPTDEQITELGETGHDTYAEITKKILSQSKVSDLGEMSAKLAELVSAAKGFNPTAAKHGFFSKAMGVLRSERERVLDHAQTVQRRIDTIVGELDQVAGQQRERLKDMATLQQENLAYGETLEKNAARAKEWLAKVEAERAAPAQGADPTALARTRSLERADQRLQAAVNDIENAAQLARQQASEIQMTRDNSAAILEEFVKTKTLVIPALQSILAQYLVGLEQKKAASTDTMLRDTLAQAMKENAELTGDNAVEIASLQQKSMINVQTIADCQTLLEGATAKIREIEEAGRAQRAQDAAKRAEIERRMRGAPPEPTAHA